MSEALPDISVCICTYKRPELLQRLLEELARQNTYGQFTYSIVVVDNDLSRSAEAVVPKFGAHNKVRVSYCVEPQQNIALARNKAVANATGDYVAFVDDDEYPAADWLFRLFDTRRRYGVAGVLGPVKPSYACPPPVWAIKGRFFERPSYPTGYRLKWTETRTGNALFDKQILATGEMPFQPQFYAQGEDQDFFRRMMAVNHVFVWCDEAVVYETVPASRCNRTYLLKRALLRGSNFPKHRAERRRNIIKSLIAIPCYTIALPFVAVGGQHLFLSYLIKICDHASRLLAFGGLRVIRNRSVIG